MAFIIPDEGLDQLICCTCKKYLSVKPVKVYAGGVIKCGRCSEDEDDGVVSLFGNVAENGLFRCVNRYEGCMKYLTYSEVSDHENQCPSEDYQCPLCPPGLFQPVSAYQLLYHYKMCHKDDVLLQSEFFLDINDEYNKNFLYCKNDYIYIIYIRRYINEKYLHINTSVIGPKEMSESINQKVRLYTLDKKLLCETKKQPCSYLDNNSNAFRFPLSKLVYKTSSLVICSLDFDTTELTNFITLPTDMINIPTVSNPTVGLHNTYPKIYLSEEFKELHPEYYLSPCKTKILKKVKDNVIEFPRICYFCENIFQNSGELNDIYKCIKNHFICQTCFNANSECCEGKYFFAEEETEIYNLLFFYCKYDCKRFYCGQDLRYHETHCKENREIFSTQEELGKKYFGNNYVTTNCLTKDSNIFFFDNIISQSNISKMYVVTRDKFNFILHCLREKNSLRFWFSHNYPHEKYYFLVRIKERHLAYYHRVNSFTLDPNNKNIIYFSVLLRTL